MFELTDVQLAMSLEEVQHCCCYLQMERAHLGQHHRTPGHWDPRLIAHVPRVVLIYHVIDPYLICGPMVCCPYFVMVEGLHIFVKGKVYSWEECQM